MDPATIALIVSGITEAMKFALKARSCSRTRTRSICRRKRCRGAGTAIRDKHYAPSRKTWDDAGGQQA